MDQSKAGRALEDQVVTILKHYNFEKVNWGDYKKQLERANNPRLKFTMDQIPKKLLIKGHRYTSVRGHKNSKMDWVVKDGDTVRAVIEAKSQNEQGSTANKLTYAVLDLAHQADWTETECILLTGGALDMGAKESSEYYSHLFAERIAAEGLALCQKTEEGLWVPITEHLNNVTWMDVPAFTRWAHKTFNTKRTYEK